MADAQIKQLIDIVDRLASVVELMAVDDADRMPTTNRQIREKILAIAIDAGLLRNDINANQNGG